MQRHTLLTLSLSSLVLGLVACTTAATEESEGDGATVESESAAAASVADLDTRVSRSTSLAALKAAAIADVETYEISVKDIDVPTDDGSTGVQLDSGFSTRGLDWFQNPDVSYPNNKSWSQGTDTGKKCQWANIFRFEAIFADPPAEAKAMKDLEGGRWRGSFWGWTDDYASKNKVGTPTASYAWSSGLWKWIGASGKTATSEVCRLPTKKMVIAMMTTCLEYARDNDGDPKGCRMPANEE